MKVYVSGNGCNNLRLDTMLTKHALGIAKQELVTSPAEADLIIYSACGARTDTEERSINEMRLLLSQKQPEARFVLSGCLPNINSERIDAEFNGVSNTIELVPGYELPEYLKILEAFNQADQDRLSLKEPSGAYISDDEIAERVKVRDMLNKVDPSAARYYESTTPGILFGLEKEPPEQIVISRGCYYRCSYCVIWKGRGPYESLPEVNIVEKIKGAESEGIVLTSDESGKYGLDLRPRSNLSQLVDNIIEIQPEHHFYLRNLEPSPLEDHGESLSRFADSGLLYHLCVPVQSGSPRILNLMRRNYDPVEVLDNLKKFREKGVLIETHIMVGFPGETIDDLGLSLQFIEELEPDNVQVIPYTDRPGAPSTSMDGKITDDEVRNRIDSFRFLRAKIVKDRYTSLLPDSIPNKQELIDAIVHSLRTL
ncbi:MAG: radical SAM protein [Nanoarchaeota archaeon]|nr:radical SAM protein [Nanoarchaeota archaeon]